MNKWIRKDLQNFIPYNENEIPYTYKMNANESPFHISTNVKNKIIEYLNNENLKIYPNSNCTELVIELAKFYNTNEENISIGVGSDAIIDYIIKGFIDNNEKVLFPNPSFAMYKITTQINKGQAIEYLLDNEYNFSKEEIVQRINSEDIKLLFICNPNNPTGTAYSKDMISWIIENVSIPIIIDEAYGEFAPELSFIPDVKKYNNIIILKTFSKAFGLAGLRIGYAIGHKDLIEVINTVKPPYSVSTLSQIIALETLKDYENIKSNTDNLISERDSLFKELKQFSFLQVFDSSANFIFLKSSLPIYSVLYSKGVLIRNYEKDGEKEVLRITVGLKEENQLIINILKEV